MPYTEPRRNMYFLMVVQSPYNIVKEKREKEENFQLCTLSNTYLYMYYNTYR